MDPLFFQHSLLPCGAELYWQDRPETMYVSLNAIVWAGSLQDPPDKIGLAHLFEHLPFKGTAHFADAKAMALPLEIIGGNNNASTGPAYTVFHVNVPTSHSQFAWQILEDLLFEPQLTAEMLRTEVPAVFSEINDAGPERVRKSYERLQTVLMGEDYGRRANIAGTRKSLRNVTIDDLRSFHEQFYRPANVTFVISGNLSQFAGGVEGYINQRLRRFGEKKGHPRPSYRAQVGSLPQQWTERSRQLTQPIVWLAGPMHDVSLSEKMAIQVIDSILCSRGASSVLFHELRERRGLVYGVTPSFAQFTPTVAYWKYDVRPHSAKEVPTCQELLADILSSPATYSDQQIEWSFQAMLGMIALMSWPPMAACHTAVARLTADGEIPTLDELMHRLKSLTPEEIRIAAAKYFNPERWVSVSLLSR